MTLYLDTSLVVAALTNEEKTEPVLAWLDAQASDELAIGELVVVEVSSALSIKLRTGQLEAPHRASALAAFNRMVVENLTMLAISSTDIRIAAGFADRHDLGLRAGDAIHLAVAGRNGATVCTLDRRMAAAGVELGVPTLLL
ncbi:MAG TPA: type II toxin-antitoxin system VapC family toxin [Caulobacteraceae bacterium]|nr:type II toxin-antitoxin system VapC family toxin [Caulobacteraceae bacterium]